MTTTPAQAVDTREAFEKWYAETPDCPSIERRGNGYKLMQANLSWGVWQAACERNLLGNAHWRTDIENAPKDGTKILLYEDGEIEAMSWQLKPWDYKEYGWCGTSCGPNPDCVTFDAPTAWRHIDFPPPAAKTE